MSANSKPLMPDVTLLDIDILEALGDEPMSPTEIFMACGCDRPFTAYFLALTNMEVKGWVRDDGRYSLTASGRETLFQLVVLGCAKNVRLADAPASVGNVGSAGHGAQGEPATGLSRYSAPCETPAGIHLVSSRQPLLKERQPEKCSNCGDDAIRECKHCEKLLCQRCAYLSDEGILCGKCTGEMKHEFEQIKAGGRA